MGGFDPRLFAAVFGVIFVAELPDKTAFASLLLATRRPPAAVFLGAAAAFAVQSLVAVAFGSLLGLLPRAWVKLGAGLLFLALAAAMWLKRGEEEGEGAGGGGESFRRAAWTSFAVVFLAEWGDLTQFATAALAARHRAPLTVFLGATSALWTVTALAVAVGHRARLHLSPRPLRRLAAAAFAVVGVALLI